MLTQAKTLLLTKHNDKNSNLSALFDVALLDLFTLNVILLSQHLFPVSIFLTFTIAIFIHSLPRSIDITAMVSAKKNLTSDHTR